MKKFLLTILSLVALVATGYTTESRAATAETLAVASITPADGSTVPNIYEITVEFNKEVWYDAMMGYGVCLIDADGNKTFGWGADYPGYTGYHEEYGAKFMLTKKIVFYQSAPITAAGEYTFRLYEETFKTNDNSEVLPRTEFKFTIAGESAPKVVEFKSVDPAEGEVESLKMITIETDTEFAGAPSNVTLTDASGVAYTCTTKLSNTWCGIKVTPSEEITTPGTYTLTIPAGALYSWADPTKKNEEKTFTWTVTGATPVITANWSMTEGQVVETFSDATIVFSGVDAVKATNSYGCYWLYEKDENGAYQLAKTTNDSHGYLDATASGTALTLSADPMIYSKDAISPFSRKGDYRIVIPAGGVYFNGDKANKNTEEYVLNFKIENDFVEAKEIDAAFTAEPANNSTISEIKEIVVTFTDYTSIVVAEPDFVMGSNIPQVLITDPDFGMTMPAGYIMARAGAAANQLVLYVDPQYTGGMESYATPGAYTVNVPAGVVKFGQDTNKAFTLNYTVSAEVAPAVQVATFTFADIWGTSANVSDLSGTTVTVDGIEMTVGKGNATSNPMYNSSNRDLRLNGSATNAETLDGNTLTFKAPEGKVITSIVMQNGSKNTYYSVLTSNNGTVRSGNNVPAYWTGYSNEVVFTANRNKYYANTTTNARYTSAVVTYYSADDAIIAVSKYDLKGDAINTFKGMDITFSRDVQVISALYGGGQTVIKNAAGESMGTCFLTAKGNTITAEYSEALTAGEYTLVLPANTIKTADGSIDLPETALGFTLKADKLAGEITFTSSPILATNKSASIAWTSTYMPGEYTYTPHFLTTFDGTEPTLENYKNKGSGKSNSVTVTGDSIFTFKVRAMSVIDGVCGDVYEQNVFINHGADALDFYRAATTMAAGNYVMFTPEAIAHTFTDASKTYGYVPSVKVESKNNIASAFDYFEWTFEATDGGYYIKDSKGRYFYLKGTYDSFNISETVPTEGGVWTVTMNEDGTAKVMNVDKQKFIQYDANYGTYAAYAEAKGTMPMLGKLATPEVVMTPNLDGTTITTNINEITFYCADGIAGGKNINSTSNYMRDNETYDRYTFQVVTVDANTMKFVFDQPLPTAEYTFNLKKETFAAAPNSFNMIWPAADKSFKFSIVNPYEVTVSPTPDDYDHVASLDTIVFSNDLGIVVDNLFEGDAPYLSYKNGDEVVKVNLVATTNVTATSIAFVPETAITTEGNYTLNVAEGYFLIGEEQEASPAIATPYILVYPVTIVSSTPAEGGKVEQFSEIVIEFSKPVVIEEPSSSYKYLLIDAAGNETTLKLERIDAQELSITQNGYTSTYTVAKKARFYVDEPVAAEGAYKVQLGNYGWEIFDPNYNVYLPAKASVNFEIKVEKLGVLSTTPAEGEEVEQFTEMIVTFNKPIYDQNKDASLYNADGTLVTTLKKEILDNVGSHAGIFGSSPLFTKVRYYAETAVTTEGNYYVQIPADAFATDDNSEWTVKTKVNFTVKAAGGATEIAATWSIEEGAELKTFESVDITFSGVESAKAKGTYSCFYFWEKNANGEWQHVENGCTAGYMDTEANGATVTFSADPGCYGDDFVSPFSRDGEYRIIIPAGDIYFNGDRANVSTVEYVLNFTIKGDPKPEEIDAAFTADPANNSSISAIEKVVLTFTEYTSIEIAELDMVTGSNIPYVYLVDELTGQGMPAGYIFFRAGAAANQLELYVDPDFNGGSASYNMAGNYMIRIPKKVVTFNNGVSKEIVLNYTVTGAEDKKVLNVVSSTPANNETVEKLESVVVDWNMNIALPKAEAGVEAYVENVHGIVMSTVKADFTGLAGNQVRYTLDTPITENGIFTLIIPAGDVVDFDTETIANEEVSLTFSVETVQGPIAVVSSTPADGETVESLETITVVFNKAVNYDSYFEKARLEDKGGKTIAEAKEVTYVDGDLWSAQTLVFTLDNKVAEANTYTFVIPAKTILDAQDYITTLEKDVMINITIGGSQVEDIYVVTSTPAEGEVLSSLSEIFVTFNTDAAIMNPPYIYNADNTIASSTTINLQDKDGNFYPDNIACLELNQPLTEQGSYYLLIAAGTVYDYPNYQVSNSQDIRINFEITTGAIKGIAVDPELGYVVYDLNGYRVMQTKKASDLNRLNNGLYIINGVKVLINK